MEDWKNYEVVIYGDDLTHELWKMARDSFLIHGGRCLCEKEPKKRAGALQTRNAKPSEVTFSREIRRPWLGLTMVYSVYRAPDAASAKAFLQQDDVPRVS